MPWGALLTPVQTRAKKTPKTHNPYLEVSAAGWNIYSTTLVKNKYTKCIWNTYIYFVPSINLDMYVLNKNTLQLYLYTKLVHYFCT